MNDDGEARRYDAGIIGKAHEIAARGDCNNDDLITAIADALQDAVDALECARVRARYAEDKYVLMREIADRYEPEEVGTRIVRYNIEHPMPGDYVKAKEKARLTELVKDVREWNRVHHGTVVRWPGLEAILCRYEGGDLDRRESSR